MSTETTADVSLVQDEDLLRKMWQETDDFDKKKEIRSHMYKIREARLKDFYTTGEETSSSSENKQHSMTTTTRTSSSTTGLKGSDLTTHADSLADHSFLSLKSKEIRDSESPTKESYKITETKKIDDRDWNIVESSEASKDGKMHTTSRIATTSGKHDLDGGEMKYSAKSEQKASVYKDGDDKNFTKSTGASSQNVIKQQAFGGDDNSKFYSTSTTTSSSSKLIQENRSTTSDAAEQLKIDNGKAVCGDSGDRYQKITTYEDRLPSGSSTRTSQTVVRKVYTENIPNEFKNHPSYIDGNTKVTTETKTLPDGSTVTTTRYETKGATQYSSSSTASATSSSTKNVSSKEQTSGNFIKSHVTTENVGRSIDDRSVRDNIIDNSSTRIIKNQVESKSLIDKSDLSRNVKNEIVENRQISESDIRRLNDAALIGREMKNAQNIDVTIKICDLPTQEAQTATTITKNIETIYDNRFVGDGHDTKKSNIVIISQELPTQTTQSVTTVTKKVSTNYDGQQISSDDLLNSERQHVAETRSTKIKSMPSEIKPIAPKSQPRQEENKKPKEIAEKKPIAPKTELAYDECKEPVQKYTEVPDAEFITPKEQPERRQPIRPGKSEWDEKSYPTEGQYDTTYRTDYVPKRISVEVSPTHDAFARSLRSISPERIGKTGSTRSLRTSSTSLRSTSSPDRYSSKPSRGSPASSKPLSPTKRFPKSPDKYCDIETVPKKRYESPEKQSPETLHDKYVVEDESTAISVNTDTITKKKKTTSAKTEIDSSTLTKKKETSEKPRSRSVSPTSTASDIEFIRHRTDVVTDLDVDEVNKRTAEEAKLTRRHTEEFDRRPSSLESTSTKKPQKVTEKSATSSLTEFTTKKSPSSPVKESYTNRKSKSPTKEPVESPTEKTKPKGIRRTDTYEERCKEILGISDVKDTQRKPSLPGVYRETAQSPTKPKKSTVELKDVKPIPITKRTQKSPEKEPSGHYTEKSKPSVQEYPSQIRKSLEKEPLGPYPEKQKSTKKAPYIQEFPSQVRKSPTKEPLAPRSETPKSTKQSSTVQEFPSHIRKSPEKQPSRSPREKTKETRHTSPVQEFPSQVRKSPEKKPSKDTKYTPSIQEFPSQIRKVPEKELLEPYPEKTKPSKQTSSVQEFPSQIRKSPGKEPLEKPSNAEETPSVQQTEKHLEPYSEMLKALPAQKLQTPIEKLPGKEWVEPYPKKPCVFPSQMGKPLEKEPLYLEREKPKSTEQIPHVEEYPSQVRKLPKKEPSEKSGDTKQEFPLQIKKSPDKEPLQRYSEKQTSVVELPTQIKKSPEKESVESDIEKPTSFIETPRSSDKVSLDDLPRVKTNTVSLEDIRLVKQPDSGMPSEKISLDDLKYKPDRVVDNFIAKEKIDTEITLKKYRDDSIQVPRGIPDVQSHTKETKTKKSKVVKKSKTETDTYKAEDDSDSSTEEETEDTTDRIESEIIEDICDVVECIESQVTNKDAKVSELTRVIGKKQISPTKTSDTTKFEIKSKLQKHIVQEPQVEDFVTVTKTQLLGSSSETPVEEPIQTKKFISTLCKEEEEDNLIKTRMTLTKKEYKEDNISVDEQTVKSNKTVKKDHPNRKAGPMTKSPDKKKQTEQLINKEKLDSIVKTTVNSRRIETKTALKEPTKKILEEKKTSVTRRKGEDAKTYETEYVDQYCATTKDKKISKPTAKVSTKITLTPVKQTQVKKTSTDVQKDTKLHIKTLKIDNLMKKVPNGTLSRPNQPVSKFPISPGKKPEDQQPKRLTKLKVIEVKQPHPTTKTTVQKMIPVQPARRHVESTIINIKPKVKPETITKIIHKTTVTKTITSPKTTKVASKDLKMKQKLTQNGHIYTDEDKSDVEIIESTEEVSVQEPSKTRKSVESTRKQKKCITTKSILIENAVADEREIIVDLRRSKSSREGTPDRICPYPVSSDVDLGVPRYPDRINEPEDGTYRPKPKSVSDIPLNEMENVTEFGRVTEVTGDVVGAAKTEVEGTDECLLTVNEKVNKFLSTAEQVTKKPIDAKPAPKVERPKLEVDDALKEDECLLSVSDKVHKFITTAEQLAAGTKETFQRSKSPKYKDDDKDFIPKDKDIRQPEEIVFKIKKIHKDLTANMDKEEQLIARKSISPEKTVYPSKPITREGKSPIYVETDSSKYKTPERKRSDSPYTKKTTEEIIKIRRESFEGDSTPKTTRRTSKDEPRTILSPTGRLRSTETIKKAKALFENVGKEQDTIKQKDILNRPSVFEGRKLKKTEQESDEKRIKDVPRKYDEVRSSSPDKPRHMTKPREDSPAEEIPHYMIPLDRTVREHETDGKVNTEQDAELVDLLRSRDNSVDREIPHYMLPLDRTLRERSPHKENLKQLEDIMNKSTGTVHSEEVDVKTTKFGVTLRRTDSGRMVTTHRKSSTASVDKQVTELEIEEIFDLEYLEKLLETVVGYDIRRRIRTQIRVIKRSIEENTFESLVTKCKSSTRDNLKRSMEKCEQSSETKQYSNVERRRQSQERTTQYDSHVSEVSEYQSSYSKRKTSSEFSTKLKSPSPDAIKREPTPKTLKDKSQSPVRKPNITETDSTETRTTTTSIFQTDLKKAKPLTKTVVQEKPEWVTQRTLRKVSETSAPIKKIVSTTTKKVSTRKESGDVKPTDVITSSYGVGPTDENGTPLFGLKALRAQNKSEKMKVQGTVIQSHYYSENGGEPEGEISVTKFSTDPSDLGSEATLREKGIATVRTTQKFGYKGTPSLKTITSKNKKTSEEDIEHKSTVKTSKVTRRGSVKEISQKFIENAVDTLKSERQSSYPKAGLILRTSSFKDTSGDRSDSSKEGSPAKQEIHEERVTSVKTISTTSDGKRADTFLTNKSKVTGVQDAISRMKTKEIQMEESEEDVDARNLLNKFIGTQVLLSGMESHVSKPVTTSTESVKRTTKITTTTTSSESSKPTTVTRTFTHPITADLLETVWDEQTLKLLLEQSTDYEDRRIIRARLREVMAEQEACAELVERASDEVTMKESGSAVHGTTTRTYSESPVTTTSQTTTRITSQQQVKKPMSPFAKFRQLDKQNSLNSPPSTPKSPTGSGLLFKFTDPSLSQSANTVKQRLLQWCQMKTKEYENIQLDNFSTSWADGMAFCALIHHFLPDAFDYKTLNPRNRRQNFTLAFRIADEKAGIAPLLDVDDMVAISKPDWKCVFTYVQSIYRRFKDED